LRGPAKCQKSEAVKNFLKPAVAGDFEKQSQQISCRATRFLKPVTAAGNTFVQKNSLAKTPGLSAGATVDLPFFWRLLTNN